mmetsp:Transcript_857/g.1936  ORF Transcript_857/g.1936 Transcript_857/m.1936 type:complete len:335 (-) Transcript_857:243-1247(-)
MPAHSSGSQPDCGTQEARSNTKTMKSDLEFDHGEDGEDCNNGESEDYPHLLEGMTTLMFRYIPRRFTSKDVICKLEGVVHWQTFDYVYVPWDKSSSNNMGYAFVNFVSTEAAAQAAAALHNTVWRTDRGWPKVKISAARVQGLSANVLREHVGSNSVSAPRVFYMGVEIPVEVAREMQANGNRLPSALQDEVPAGSAKKEEVKPIPGVPPSEMSTSGGDESSGTSYLGQRIAMPARSTWSTANQSSPCPWFQGHAQFDGPQDTDFSDGGIPSRTTSAVKGGRNSRRVAPRGSAVSTGLSLDSSGHFDGSASLDCSNTIAGISRFQLCSMDDFFE